MSNLPSKVVLVNPPTVPVTKSLPAIKAIAKDKRLTQKAKTVFLGLYAFTGKDCSKCWPSVKALCDVLSMSHHTINAALKELQALDYLFVDSSSSRNVFHLRKSVEITVQVTQTPWNSPSDNPEHEAQRTLGTKAKTVGSTSDRIGSTADKGTQSMEVSLRGKEDSSPENRLMSHYEQLSERQKPILLDQIRTSAFKLRERSKHEGEWDSESERKRFVALRNFHKQAEAELFGVPVTDWR